MLSGVKCIFWLFISYRYSTGKKPPTEIKKATHISDSGICQGQVVKYQLSIYQFRRQIEWLNPSNAEATFVQSTGMQIFFENHLNPVMLVFIR